MSPQLVFCLRTFAAVAVLTPLTSLAALTHSVGAQIQIFIGGDPAFDSNFVEEIDGQDSLDLSLSGGSGSASNSGVVNTRLQGASVGLLATSTSNIQRGGVMVRGFMTDTIIFDLQGAPSAQIPFSISVSGSINGNLWNPGQQCSIQSILGTGSAGTGVVSIADLFGSTYSGVATVFDGQETSFSLNYQLAMTPSAFAPDVAFAEVISNNSADFSWTLPEGVTYESASGVFAPVPIPATAWLLASALGLLGWARRKTA